MIKRNLLANFIGQGWTALISLAFVPLYIKYLGIEAYGLIGLFSLMTAWLSLLDMGMTPTLSREMARFTAGSRSIDFIRDLLRSIEIIIFCIALAIAFIIALSSHWIATYWLTSDALAVDTVTHAFEIMGLVAALRFAESIYRSTIIGLQRQVMFNAISSILATFRAFGAFLVLVFWSSSIQAFFAWQAFMSILALLVFASITYTLLPGATRSARFSISALQTVWRFAGGMIGITFLSLLLTQVDKILLSKLLSLKDFGYYTLAATVAGTIYMIITPVTQAIYPRLCELQVANNFRRLCVVYHKSAQLVTVFAGSAAMVIIVFSQSFLQLWTQNVELSKHVAPLLSLLLIGNLLNGLMMIPYVAQLAFGWTSLSIRINCLAVALIVPAILWATPRFGASGAALAWVTLNIGYLAFGIHYMHKKILIGEKMSWYFNDLAFPLVSGLSVALAIRYTGFASGSILDIIVMLLLASILVFAASMLSANLLRPQIFVLMRKCLNVY